MNFKELDYRYGDIAEIEKTNNLLNTFVTLMNNTNSYMEKHFPNYKEEMYYDYEPRLGSEMLSFVIKKEYIDKYKLDKRFEIIVSSGAESLMYSHWAENKTIHIDFIDIIFWNSYKDNDPYFKLRDENYDFSHLNEQIIHEMCKEMLEHNAGNYHSKYKLETLPTVFKEKILFF